MALVLRDRVSETTTTTGTGTVTLLGAVSGFQAFSAIGDGNSTYYAIVDSNTGDWEVGEGVYTSSGTTLSRATIFASSNSGSAVNFGAGVKDVFCTYPASKARIVDLVQTVSTNTTADPNTVYVLTASLTLTLPASPSVGQFVRVSNQSGTATAVIARNGQSIMGLAEDLTFDVLFVGLTLQFVGGSTGWAIL